MPIEKLICWYKGHDAISFKQHVIRHGSKRPGKKQVKRRKSFYAFECGRCHAKVKFSKQTMYTLLYGGSIKFESPFPLTWIIGQVLGAVFIAAVVATMFLIL